MSSLEAIPGPKQIAEITGTSGRVLGVVLIGAGIGAILISVPVDASIIGLPLGIVLDFFGVLLFLAGIVKVIKG
jgi:hypothetical protein